MSAQAGTREQNYAHSSRFDGAEVRETLRHSFAQGDDMLADRQAHVAITQRLLIPAGQIAEDHRTALIATLGKGKGAMSTAYETPVVQASPISMHTASNAIAMDPVYFTRTPVLTPPVGLLNADDRSPFLMTGQPTRPMSTGIKMTLLDSDVVQQPEEALIKLDDLETLVDEGALIITYQEHAGPGFQPAATTWSILPEDQWVAVVGPRATSHWGDDVDRILRRGEAWTTAIERLQEMRHGILSGIQLTEVVKGDHGLAKYWDEELQARVVDQGCGETRDVYVLRNALQGKEIIQASKMAEIYAESLAGETHHEIAVVEAAIRIMVQTKGGMLAAGFGRPGKFARDLKYALDRTTGVLVEVPPTRTALKSRLRTQPRAATVFRTPADPASKTFAEQLDATGGTLAVSKRVSEGASMPPEVLGKAAAQQHQAMAQLRQLQSRESEVNKGGPTPQMPTVTRQLEYQDTVQPVAGTQQDAIR